MNSRPYDHVPPVANNTVTISTTPQVRIAGGQLRPMAIPMRPQPVPIRKVVQHDTGPSSSGPPTNSPGPSTFSTAALHQIKEEPDSTDYNTASTSSGPLIGSIPFQQYQRGSNTSSGPLGPTTSSSGPAATSSLNNGSLAMDQPAPVSLASKVAEVFLTAGHAFQKLGDLTLQLHTTTDADESKWSEKEVDNLKNALTRFAHELDQISTCVASRTTKHIKNDIKRRHMIGDDPSTNPQIKRLALGGGPSGNTSATYTTLNTSAGLMGGHAVPLNQKRLGMQPMGKMVATRVIPTRYTVAPMSGGSAGMMGSSSTVVVSSASSSSTSGMPQLQSQSVAGSSSTSLLPQRLVGTSSGTSSARVMVPQTMIGKLSGSVMAKQRGMTPSQSASSSSAATAGAASSGALILEHNE